MGVKTRKLGNVNNQIVEWQSSIFVGDGSTGLTAVAGRGYFLNTAGGAVTVTLPASPSIGDQIAFKDWNRTFGTNNVTLASNTFDGVASTTHTFSTSGLSATCIYSGDVKGWQLINDDTTTKMGPSYIQATGGTVTTSGDYKIHTFTGDGNFNVTELGNPAGGADKVSYLVVAGGAAGSGNPNANSGGGGGAGGYREGKCTGDPYTASPLNAPAGLTITATCFPITVGAGGSGAQNTIGTSGSNSIFSTITSAGGGRGGGPIPGGPDGGTGANGGSGGGGGGGSPPGSTGGSGNTPPVSPPQGNDGGDVGSNSPDHQSGGGGGAGGVGGAGTAPKGGDGGVGVSTSITGSSLSYAGGGGGTGFQGPRVGGASPCGTGGAGTHGSPYTGGAGTANRGGGGGAAEGYTTGPNNATGGAGGKGIVIIRYKYQN